MSGVPGRAPSALATGGRTTAYSSGLLPCEAHQADRPLGGDCHRSIGTASIHISGHGPAGLVTSLVSPRARQTAHVHPVPRAMHSICGRPGGVTAAPIASPRSSPLTEPRNPSGFARMSAAAPRPDGGSFHGRFLLWRSRERGLWTRNGLGGKHSRGATGGPRGPRGACQLAPALGRSAGQVASMCCAASWMS